MLEKELLRQDDKDEEHRSIALASRRVDEETDDDPLQSRKALMRNIDDKLKEYGKNSSLSLLAIKNTVRLSQIYRR